jgi:hypothetical protein
VLLATACSAPGRRSRGSPDTIATGGRPPRPTAHDAWTVTEAGIGPVRANMTLEEANAGLGGLLIPSRALDPNCDYVRPTGAAPEVLFMVVAGRIARVDVRDITVTTAAGARIGDTEARVLRLYQGRVRVLPHHYVDGHYLVVIPHAPADTVHRIVFETDGRKVTTFRSGRWPEVEWIEGCS